MLMKVCTILLCACGATWLLLGCQAQSRYEILSRVFDGVPPPPTPTPANAKEAAPAGAVRSRLVAYGEHGPYAAKLCNACHQSAARGQLVAPKQELCFHCHEFKVTKQYVHGPLASGDCTACHNPHGSRYRYMLPSESDDFCLRCHEQAAVARNPAHQQETEARCTTCHDPHASDKRYLLR